MTTQNKLWAFVVVSEDPVEPDDLIKDQVKHAYRTKETAIEAALKDTQLEPDDVEWDQDEDGGCTTDCEYFRIRVFPVSVE